MRLSIGHYELLKTNIVKAGCPRELTSSVANLSLDKAMVIERNVKSYGMVASIDYSPAMIMVAGAATRGNLLKEGIIRSWAWVERGLIDASVLSAEDRVTTNDLLSGLQALMIQRVYGNSIVPMGRPYPTIFKVNPWDNHLTYQLQSTSYRQHFYLDPTKRSIRFTGNSVLAQPSNALTWTDPKGDLVVSVIKNWSSNVLAAVKAYLDAIKYGLYKPMKPAFAPVTLSDDGKVMGLFNQHGIAPVDFALWSQNARMAKAKV